MEKTFNKSKVNNPNRNYSPMKKSDLEPGELPLPTQQWPIQIDQGPTPEKSAGSRPLRINKSKSRSPDKENS